MPEIRGETEPIVPDQEEQSESRASALQTYWRSGDGIELGTCVVFLFLGLIPAVLVKTPRERPIPFQLIQSGEYIRNLSVNEPYDSETVSDVVLVVLAVWVPLLLQTALVRFTLRNPKGLHNTMCTYLVAFGLTFLATSSVKVYVGYLRPLFYDWCEPTSDFSSCTGDDSDARKSFPSGHASVSFCGLSLLSWYLERSFGLSSIKHWSVEEDGTIMLRYKATKVPQLYRLFSVLCLLPYALAIFIATSRIVDNEHFPADVVGGSVLGVACAHVAHQLWFPSF